MKTYEYFLVTRHSELDSSIHINNANYLRYLEEARVSMMQDLDFPMQAVHDANVEMVLYKYTCLYKQQVHYPEKLTVRSKQIQTKKVRGILRQEIYQEDETLCFQADAYWAYHGRDKSDLNATLEFTKKFGAHQYSGISPFATEKESVVNDNLPHSVCSIEVRPYELDSFQHVNNAVYANYFEVGRWNFRRTLFSDLQMLKKMDLIFVLYKITIQFIKPSFLFEELFVKTWLIDLSPIRIIYWQEIQDRKGVVRASCRSEGCIINKKGLPTRLLPEILHIYQRMLLV
jgi:acyl-CoA thioester hydrolase